MSNYYIQGSGGWPFGLDTLSPSGQLFPSRTDPNILEGYFGFPANPVAQDYFFRFWEGLDTTLNLWYGENNSDGIADLRANSLIFLRVSGGDNNSRPTIKITFNKNTKAYTRGGAPRTVSVNFVSDNSSIMGSNPSAQNNASINLYYNGWIWEKDFTFNTTSTINYKIVLGSGTFYGDNNIDGIAVVNGNFIPLNVTAGNTYRFRAKIFATDSSIDSTNFEYEVVCLTCPSSKQNQIISTPFNIYNQTKNNPPFSLQASTNSNLPLTYSSSSPLFTINNEGIITLLGLTGLGNVLINQAGNDQWFPAFKEVFINIEDSSNFCLTCLNTGSLYYTDDTYINLYNVSESGGLFLKDYNEKNKNFIFSNESWENYYIGFTGYGFSGFNNTSAGIILNINDATKNNDQNKFNINYGTNEPKNIVGNYHKQLIKIRPQKPKNIGYLGYFANDSAWATYDVSTGMITGSLTPNNIFSYAIEIVASGILSGNNFYYTGEIDVNTPTGMAYVLNLEKNPVLYKQNINTLNVISFNEIQDFCKKVAECEDPKNLEPLEVCYTGELTNETEFQFFLSGYSQLANTTVINRPEIDNSLIVPSSGAEVKYANMIYSGYILYNNWQSGDYIKWDLYGFNYIDLYQEFHLGNYPPYPNTGFILYYPNDFNSLDSLVDKLNEKIDSFKHYPVWYPYECLRNTESGIFLTGLLIKFNKNIESTGFLPISHFNNRIDFISLRSYPQLEEVEGYLNYGISIFSPKKPKKNIFSGWNYLIPTNIYLEGFNKNTQDWEILDTRTNLSIDFSVAPRIKKSMGSASGVIQEEEEEDTVSLPEEEESPPGPAICKDVIFTDIQRNINFNANPLCPPKISFRDIIVTVPKEECKEKSVDENGNIIQKKSNAELCGAAGGAQGGETDGAGGGPPPGEDQQGSIGNYYIIRTGWNLDINNIDKIYDKYKISLNNFTSVSEPSLSPKNSFFIKQVNLYTLDKSGFSPHKGPSICSIGSDYTIDVSGLFPIEISGIWTYNILPQESGIYRFFKTPFARKIEEDEKFVKFNKVSGFIISPSGTGFLSTSGYGVSEISYQNSDYYFYNPFNQSVYFTETLTGLVTGFGILSGEKTVIKQNIINQELLVGGRFSNSPSKYHEIFSDGTFISNIDNIEYVQYDVLGFYSITGRITGNTENGRLNIAENIIITGSPYGDQFAYYPVATGFTFSNILFNIDYSLLNNFDVLSLNDNTIIYHSNSSQYPAPNYFDSNNTLISIINESPNVFLCTGEIINSNIQLYSNLQGESGNINLTSNSTGIEIINFISGLNIYPRLYKIKTVRSKSCIDDDPIFADLPGNCTYVFNSVVENPIITGDLSDTILATGFYYSNQGSGNVTGNVSTFTGVRTFFDVWDVATGNLRRSYLSFLQNNFISGDSYYKNTNFGTAPTNVNLRAFYLNYLGVSTQEESDVADLIVKDLNNPNLSETGVIFRLNGLK